MRQRGVLVHELEIQISTYPFHAAQNRQENSFYKKPRPLKTDRAPEGKTHFRVLIVEDERLIAENLKFILEEKGYHVVGIAASGEEAVIDAGNTFPDLLLMDIRLQGTFDGIEAARRIRSFNRRDLPVIFLSAYPPEQFPHLNQLEADSFRYLKKPYTPGELFSVIHNLITRH